MTRPSSTALVRWLGGALLLLAAACTTPTPAPPTPAPTPTAGDGAPTNAPPNIVLIMADDLGAAAIGSYGGPIATPRLDALAAEGTRFQTCWATPVCTPSRVQLLTGQYGFRNGYVNLIGQRPNPPADSPLYEVGDKLTFADVASDRGYATALAGKWQLTGEHPDLVQECGFDRYRIWAYPEYLPAETPHTGGWQDARRTVASRYWHPAILEDARYRPTDPGDYGPDLFTDFLADFIHDNRDRPFLAYYPMVLPHGPLEPTPDPESPGGRIPAGFPAHVAYVDHLVGRLVDTIDRLGLTERTLVLFTADNGSARDGKTRTTERGVRVPLIARWPGQVPAGRVSPALVDLSDVFPTIAELTGASLPADHVIDGRSLVPVLRGEAEHREWIFSYLGRRRLLRDSRWVLEGDGQLFDCGASPPWGLPRRDRLRGARGGRRPRQVPEDPDLAPPPPEVRGPAAPEPRRQPPAHPDAAGPGR